MEAHPISGRTISRLHKYLQSNGGSYNDLRVYFGNSGIEPDETIESSSTRNKDAFLDKYIKPLNLTTKVDTDKLINFIEQVIDFSHRANAEDLITGLQQDGWQLIGTKFNRVGYDITNFIELLKQGNPLETIQREVNRAIASVTNDPADAITASSSMIEATCKYILEDRSAPLPNSLEMRDLSREVFRLLKISPEQIADQDFRAIFQSVITISNSVGSIRSKLGDAHGAAPSRNNPQERHARLTLNLAGSVCLFLLETNIEDKANLQEPEEN